MLRLYGSARSRGVRVLWMLGELGIKFDHKDWLPRAPETRTPEYRAHVNEMGEVMRYTAGATGEPYGPDARGLFFQIRGFNVMDEAFFRDGLRQRGSDFASFMSLDPYGAERFEVLKGPSFTPTRPV